ncbi:MAG: hypothetical protein ACUVQG_01245 [Thermogutta sp.]
MTDFEKRLQRAIERGHQIRKQRAEAEARRALTEQELRARHSDFRLQLTEYIEQCLKKLQDHLPGFTLESVFSERGWGSAVTQDELQWRRGETPQQQFSRLELVVRPFSEYYVLDLIGKATVRDKELFNRSFYQPLAEADLSAFTETVDRWVLEFAEAYTARS